MLAVVLSLPVGTDTSSKDDDKIKSILNYMRELSINAGGGLIAAGILQIISMVV